MNGPEIIGVTLPLDAPWQGMQPVPPPANPPEKADAVEAPNNSPAAANSAEILNRILPGAP